MSVVIVVHDSHLCWLLLVFMTAVCVGYYWYNWFVQKFILSQNFLPNAVLSLVLILFWSLYYKPLLVKLIFAIALLHAGRPNVTLVVVCINVD